MTASAGEKGGSIKTYDICDDIRTKINNYLNKTILTKVAFAKELTRQIPSESAITAAGLGKSQQKYGPLAGNLNRVYHAAYVFFEKLRLREGKAKSKERIEIDKVHGARGVITDRPFETMRCKAIRRDSV